MRNRKLTNGLFQDVAVVGEPGVDRLLDGHARDVETEGVVPQRVKLFAPALWGTRYTEFLIKDLSSRLVL